MNASTVLTGQPGAKHHGEAEFKALLDRAAAVDWVITCDEAAKCSPAQWRKLRATVLVGSLKHCNAVYESGKSRGRLGAAMVLEVCQNALQTLVPEVEGHLVVLEELQRALGKCTAGELPLLFRPGTDSNDHKAHLKLVKDGADE
jgi:hypothetical protein